MKSGFFGEDIFSFKLCCSNHAPKVKSSQTSTLNPPSLFTMLLLVKPLIFDSLAQEMVFAGAGRGWSGDGRGMVGGVTKTKISTRNLATRNRREQRSLILTYFHLNSPCNCTGNQSRIFKHIVGEKTWPLISRYASVETLSPQDAREFTVLT